MRQKEFNEVKHEQCYIAITGRREFLMEVLQRKQSFQVMEKLYIFFNIERSRKTRKRINTDVWSEAITVHESWYKRSGRRRQPKKLKVMAINAYQKTPRRLFSARLNNVNVNANHRQYPLSSQLNASKIPRLSLPKDYNRCTLGTLSGRKRRQRAPSICPPTP